MRVGIAGCGNVGKAAISLLNEKQGVWLREEGLDLKLTCVLNSAGGVADAGGLDCAALAERLKNGRKLADFPGFDAALDFKKIMEEGIIDLLMEFTPTNKETGEPGLTHIREALAHGVHVTTGNKGAILAAWEELSRLARERGLLLGIGCTTGGALPSVIAGREAMAGSDVDMIEGVLNGTTNFILSRMEDGLAYEDALKEAQESGIAETDPGMDVDGWDTAMKLLILAKVVMGAKLGLNDVPVTGVTRLSSAEVQRERAAGRRVKLIGRVWRERGEIRASVAPESVGPGHPFHSVSFRDKCVRYTSDTLGDLFISGGASGPTAAAASAFRDVILARRQGKL